MVVHKRYLLVLGLSFLTMCFLITLDMDVSSNGTGVEKGDFEKDFTPPELSGTSDDLEFYRENQFNIFSYIFGSSWDSDWARSGEALPVTVNRGASNYAIEMKGIDDLNLETANVTYNADIPEFIQGNLIFDYEVTKGGDLFHRAELYIEVYDTVGGLNWHIIGSQIGNGSGTANISLNGRATTYSGFNIQFRFESAYSTDIAYIDNVRISNHEFCWTEADDEIDPDVSQNIQAFINPNFANFNRDNVTLRYSINDVSLSQSVTASDPGAGNNFTFNIGEGNYSSSDSVNYQIWINNNAPTTYHHTTMSSFKCEDILAPTISSVWDNHSTYHDDVLVSCYVEDDTYGEELDNVVMYIKNGSTAGKSDQLILSNRSGSIPAGGGYFGFTIDKSYLTSRQDLYYRIYATDKVTPTANERSQDGSFNLTDDVDPVVSFVEDNAGPKLFTIECTTNLKLNYSITEPLAGIGLNSVELRVWVSDSPPTGNDDYNFTVSPSQAITLNGGTYIFEIDSNDYTYGKMLYCFINATDLSDNAFLDHTTYRNYTVVDLSAPGVVDNPSNANPVNYNESSKTLSFTLSEPPAGAGIRNGTLRVYYQLNDASLSSPNDKDIDIYKYGGVANFDIDGLDWSFGDIVYYRLNVSDLAWNNYSSSILSFTITDTVKPHYSGIINNTNGWTYDDYKSFNFTVSDPNYDIGNFSSGIASIEFYWKAGSAPTTSDYHGKISDPIQSIIKNQSTYTFNLSLDSVLMKSNGPNIYYIINVSDNAGAYNISSAGYFTLYSTAYNPESMIQPLAVIPSAQFTVAFNLYFHTDIWYTLDGADHHNERISYTDSFSKSFTLAEGIHSIVFHYQDNLTTYTVNVEIDLTAPSQISDFTHVLYGLEVVLLTWKAPTGADLLTTYKIYRSTSPTFQLSNATLLTTINHDAPALRFEDTTISQGSTYYYVIVAIDRVGNISKASAVISLIIPQNPIMLFIILAMVGVVSVVSLVVVKKKVSSKKREMLFSKVDLKDLDVDDEIDYEKVSPKSEQWTSITTTATLKPVVNEAEIDFTGEAMPTAPMTYWRGELGHLVSTAAKFESEGNPAQAYRIFLILLRLSKRNKNPLMTLSLKAKLDDFYEEILE